MGRRRAVPDRRRAAGPACVGQRDLHWRRAAEEALAGAPRPTRGLFFSKNFTAIGTVVRAGLAATTCPPQWSAEACAVSGDEGMPELSLTRMGLIHAPGRQTEEAKALAEAIRTTVGAPARRPLDRRPASPGR